MPANATKPAADELNFDRAIPAASALAQPAAQPNLSCSLCHAAIDRIYYQIDKKSVCSACHGRQLEALQLPKGWQTFVLAALFGVGGAIGGALFYAIDISSFEVNFGAVAAAFGVTWAVRLATRGRGALRYQLLSVVLTYLSIGLAWVPTFAESGDATAIMSTVPRGLALPVLAVTGMGYDGYFLAILVGVAEMVAWKRLSPTAVEIAGPFRLGVRTPVAGA